MKVMTLYFDREGQHKFHKMTQVLLYSAKLQGIDIDLVILGEMVGRRDHKHDNMVKFDAWYHYFKEQPYGAEILFLDSDTFILRDVSDVFKQDFDIAITRKTDNDKINSGVVFVKKNKDSERFFDAWYKNQQMLYEDQNMLEPLYSEYRGINQAAFMLTITSESINLISLPCKKYNAFKGDHLAPHDPELSIVHCHFGDLRTLIFGGVVAKKSNKRRAARRQALADKWKDFYSQAKHINIQDYEYKLKGKEQWRNVIGYQLLD